MATLNSTRKTMLVLVAASLALGSLLSARGLCDSWVLAFVALARGKFVFFSLSFLGVGIANLVLAPPEKRSRILLATVTLEVLLGFARNVKHLPVAAGIGFGAGLVGFFWLAREKNTDALVDVLVLSLFPAYAEMPLSLTETLRPMVMDGFVAHAEQGFGFDFARWLALATRSSLVLWQLLNAIYMLLLPALLTAYALRARRYPAHAHETIVAFVLAGTFGFTCYLLFPVVGPDPSIIGYPDAGGESLAGDWFLGGPGPRNCMPSLHTAWALIIYFRTHGLRLGVRAGAAVFTTCTMLATVGLTHHYLLDLVVAVPFAVTVNGYATQTAPGDFSRKLRLAGLGAALVAGWLVMLAWGWQVLEQHGWLLWLVTASTLLMSVWLRRAWVSLQRA